MNFQVEAFKEKARSKPHKEGKCLVTFHNIQTNAQLAGYSFKVASENIALMARTYEPPRNNMLPKRMQSAETRTARLSYALGIVNGLEMDVNEGLEEEEETRKSNLTKAQMAAKTGEAYDEDSYSGDHEDGYLSNHDDGYTGDGSHVLRNIFFLMVLMCMLMINMDSESLVLVELADMAKLGLGMIL